jgi:cytochrome oxidase assembly protein ShyY1
VVHPGSSRDGARARLGRGRQAVAPFYIDLEQPVPESGIPKPGPLEVHLKDDHLQYAITWFGLAGAVVIAFGCG